MKIRTVTGFIECDASNLSSQIKRINSVLNSARTHLVSAGSEVHFTRVALPPITQPAAKLIAFAKRFEKELEEGDIQFASLGVLPPELTERIPELMSETSRIFLSSPLTENGTILRHAMSSYAKTVLELSRLPAERFGTLRHCLSASCSPHIPFFPAAYAQNDDFSFSLAMECADLALESAKVARSLDEAQSLLTAKIEAQAAVIEPLMERVATETGAHFHGCDWSLATHPNPACSVGAAIEALSGAPFGEPGTLSVVATLTRAVKTARVKHIGFSGIFLPLLEDLILAQRTSEDRFDLQTLLLYCAVCGAGLDTIPLPEDVSSIAMAAMLMDVATLASVHRKPLTVRFMPTVGLKLGDITQFDFPFLINAKTMKLSGGNTKLFR
jgi:uncharacterized protein (UPF0210 family)